MTSESPTYHYDAPRIEEVLVSGDLAVVRVVWTLHVSGPTPAEETVETENGVDVFRRQPDGAWRILLSHAFPEPR
jgi:ketosteroid isomerase-like protein